MSLIRKIKKNKEEYEKYSYISCDDLEKLKKRALDLADELKCLDVVSQPDEYKVRLKEYVGIISDLKKYKKYAKN